MRPLAELWFYHLESSELEQALPPLLEKCLARGWRALVRCPSPERLEALDEALWTYRDDAFLPHGREGDRHPVLLTDRADNPNGAKVVFALDGAEEGNPGAFERVCVLFDGRDEAAVAQARERWKKAKDAGYAVSYWRETARGKWEKKA